MVDSWCVCDTHCSGLITEDSSQSQSVSVSVLGVLVVLVVGRVVGGQRGPVDPGVVERTVTLVPTASLHHEVTTHRPLGHV